MPEKDTLERAQKDKRQGKAQAGEFVKEEFDHIREGKHGARSAKQAIAIGLSKARRAGVDAPPKGKAAKKKTMAAEGGRKKAPTSKSGGKKTSAKRSQAAKRALQREGRQAASHQALSRQAKQASHKKKTSAKKKTTSKKASKKKRSKR